MRTDLENVVIEKLEAAGLRKLPAPVVDALLRRVQGDVASALAKSVARRTSPACLPTR